MVLYFSVYFYVIYKVLGYEQGEFILPDNVNQNQEIE